MAKVDLENRLQREREARKQAESLLEEKSRQLWKANGELQESKDQLEHLVDIRTQELSKALEQAQRANKAKLLFLNSVNHELRTPLNALINASILIRETSAPEEQQKLTNLISRSSENLHHRITQILDLTSIEAGQSVLEESDIFLPELIDEILAVYQNDAQQKGLSLWAKYHRSTTRWIRTDADRLRQILLNLIENAIRYTNSGGVSIEVSRVQGNARSGFLFSVQDTGPGLPKELQNELFEPFSGMPVDGSKQDRGIGLGLSVALYSAQLIQSTLKADSTEQGSRFELLLPLSTALTKRDKALTKYRSIARSTQVIPANANVENNTNLQQLIKEWRLAEEKQSADARKLGLLLDPTPEEYESTCQSADFTDVIVLLSSQKGIQPKLVDNIWFFNHPLSSFQLLKQLLEPNEETPLDNQVFNIDKKTPSLHILIVDDSLANQMITQSMLERLAHKTRCVSSGVEAIASCMQVNFDLVLMDLRMPGMNGLEAAQQILSQANNHDLPIIALTANTLETDRRQCRDAGMVDYLSKPVDYKLLRAVLTKWSDKRSNHISQQILLDTERLERLKQEVDPVLIPEIGQLFLKETESRIKKIVALYSDNKVREIGQEAHPMKSAAGSFGAAQLQQLAQTLESAAIKGNQHDVSKLINQTEDCFHKTHQALQQFFVSLNLTDNKSSS